MKNLDALIHSYGQELLDAGGKDEEGFGFLLILVDADGKVMSVTNIAGEEKRTLLKSLAENEPITQSLHARREPV